MLLVSYDISNDKLRAQFSKFLEKFGHRIQYSLFEIDNSKRFLSVIDTEIELKYGKKFAEADSVYVFNLSAQCKIKRYGYAKHEETDIIVVT